MKTIHVDVNGENLVTFQCPFCERSLSMSVSKFEKIKQQCTIRRCCCSRHFQLVLNFRRFKRREVIIVGEAQNLSGRSGDWTVMTIMNLSRGGLRFKILEPISMQMGDRIRVRYTVDDPREVLVDEEVIVRNTAGDEFGCEFVDISSQPQEFRSDLSEVAA